MSKSVALLLVLVFLMASCIIVAKPALSSADVAEDSWTPKAPMHQARSNLGVAAVNGKIYAIGGSTLEGSPPYTGGIVGTNEEYDPATDTWSFKKPMPTPRKDFGVAVYQNKIYCIGGEIGGPSEGLRFDLNQIYDTETDSWSYGTPVPLEVVGAAGVTTGVMAPKRIYVFGETSTQVYDAKNDKWTSGVPMPTYRRCFGVTVVNDIIYVIGGGTADGIPFGADPPSLRKYATNEQYTPIGYGTPAPSYVPPNDSAAPQVAVTTPIAIAAVIEVISLAVYYVRRKRANQTVQE